MSLRDAVTLSKMHGKNFRDPNIACTAVPHQSAPFSNQDVIAVTIRPGHLAVHRANQSSAGKKRVLAHDDYSLVLESQFAFENRLTRSPEVRVWTSMFGVGELHCAFSVSLCAKPN
jgi:hypothetical protein